MAETRKSRRDSRKKQSFHEFLPGATMNTYDIFPVRRDAYFEDDYVQEMEDSEESAVRGRMVKQLLLLVGLLLIQFILFVVLIRSTLSLT